VKPSLWAKNGSRDNRSRPSSAVVRNFHFFFLEFFCFVIVLFFDDNQPLSEKLFRLEFRRLDDFEFGSFQSTVRIANNLNEIFSGSCRSSDRDTNLPEFSGQNIFLRICDVELLLSDWCRIFYWSKLQQQFKSSLKYYGKVFLLYSISG